MTMSTHTGLLLSMENMLGTMGVSSTFINGERARHDDRLLDSMIVRLLRDRETVGNKTLSTIPHDQWVKEGLCYQLQRAAFNRGRTRRRPMRIVQSQF
jgi:hypothetical protein